MVQFSYLARQWHFGMYNWANQKNIMRLHTFLVFFICLVFSFLEIRILAST